MITAAQMARAMPLAAHAGRIAIWYPLLADAMARHLIGVNEQRQAMFLANLAEETGELRSQEENLHYSGDRLLQLFPSLFRTDATLPYRLAAAGPEAIANYIYADVNRPQGYRMGNTKPGDGWKYRGRGPMQITGRDNYVNFFHSIGVGIDTDPDELLKPEFGANSAAFFWRKAGCNELADAGDFIGAVKAVNGGTTNLEARQRYLSAFRAAFWSPA